MYVDQINVGHTLVPGQKWWNSASVAQMTIDKVNQKNATFSGSYQANREGPFPLHGQFDPAGITIGWVVSYEWTNFNSLGAWTGYARVGSDNQTTLSMKYLIADQDTSNTTSDSATFILL